MVYQLRWFQKTGAISELKTGFHLRRNKFKPLAKSILILLGLTAASAAEARIHKKNHQILYDYTDNLN